VFHVALYSGVFLRSDAISRSLRLKLDIVTALAAAGLPIRVTVFTQATDYSHDCIRSAKGVHELTTHPEFHDADVHIFEFGIRYDLFNAIILLQSRSVRAVYHNVTPPDLVEPELRPTLEASLVQKHNLFWAQRIACVSDFNRDDLITFGISTERLTVLNLPPAIKAPAREETRPEFVRLLYVGRFVRAKGVLDLVAALVKLARAGSVEFTATLIGHRAFSSPQCFQQIEDIIAREHLEDVVRIIASPTDEQLGALYSQSDALVVPSYHEGYCLPVIESMAAGCYVIAYDAGNLPDIVGGLGTLVPTGDVTALADAILRYVTMVRRSREADWPLRLPLGPRAMPEHEWRRAVADYVDTFSPEAYARGFLDFLSEAAVSSPRGARFVASLTDGAVAAAVEAVA
jgi:glycosyltransferase involved in cell wall biosynthesis